MGQRLCGVTGAAHVSSQISRFFCIFPKKREVGGGGTRVNLGVGFGVGPPGSPHRAPRGKEQKENNNNHIKIIIKKAAAGRVEGAPVTCLLASWRRGD